MKKLAILTSVLLAALLAVGGTPASGQGSAVRIHLIHGIPGVDVDVEVDGAVVFSDFAFGDTQDLGGLAGQTLKGLKVKVAGTDDVAIDGGDLALPSTGNYTALAHLDADGKPALAVFENDASKIEAGKGRLIVRHAASAPAVDILANGAVAFSNVANGAEGKADLAVGTISATVVPTGAKEPVVIGPADLPIADGEVLIVYATGALDDGLQVLTENITGLGTTPTAVNTGDSPVNSSSPLLPASLVALAAMGMGLVVRRNALVRA